MNIDLYILAFDVFKHKNLTIYHYYGKDSFNNFVLLEYIHRKNGVIEGEISFISSKIESEIKPIIVFIDYNDRYMSIYNAKESLNFLKLN